MMKKGFVSFLCFLFFIFSLSFGEDRGNGIEVRSTSPQVLEIEPGRIVTGSFLISNNAESEEELIQTLNLPAGWDEIVSDEFPLRLNPEEQQIRVIAFLVPQTSAAGSYQISYSVRSQRDYSIADSDSISVVVLPVTSLQILVEKRPETVLAGETYQVTYRLVNKGNSRTDVKLEAKLNPAYSFHIEPTNATLELGKSQNIRIVVRTDEKLKRRIKNMLEIKAETEESKTDVVSAKQTVSVEIIPKVTGEFDPHHKLPAKATLISAGRKGKGGFQAELSGRGSLDEKGKRRIDFLFRGPDIQDRSRRGKRDEYWLSYRQKYLDLHFGDRSYSLSPLTQRFNYGRGVEANIRPGKFGLGAFYLKNRWGEPKGRAVGTYLEYRLNDKFGIKGNFLKKKKGSTYSFKGYDEKIYSIQGTIRPVETLTLDLEVGLCDSDSENKLSELAFRMDLQGRLSDQIRYSLEKIYADPNYFGYYKDVDYTTGTITFPIYRKLRGDLSYRAYENNLDVDSTKGIANQEKTYQAGIFYSFPFGTHLSLKYKDLTNEDYALPADFKYQEKTLKLGLTHTFGKFSLSSQIERGELKDKLLDKTNDNLERYNLYASFRPNRRHSYSFFATIGHTSFTQQPERTKSAGISSSWNIKNNVSLSLRYRKEIPDSERDDERDDLFSTFTYTLRNNHALVLRTDWSKHEQKKGEFSFLIMYTIPLKIPVSKKKSIGVLKGKVYDNEKLERPPIPKAILTANGVNATSDENGDFIFPSLEPGIYYLRVEKSSIGLHRVAMRKQPIIIEVKGGKTTEIEIGVVTSCRIFGRVAVFTPDSDKDFGSQDTSIILGSAAPPQGRGKILSSEPKQPSLSRELLKTRETIFVSPVVSFVIRCFKGSEKMEYFSGKEVFLKVNSDGIILSEGNNERLEEKIKRVIFIPQDEELRFSLNGKEHSGILEVIFVSKDSSLLALNRSGKKDYPEGTVSFGMGNQGIVGFEAQKPKTVAASSESQSLIDPGKVEESGKDDLRNEKGLGNILVEITKENEVLHQLTDEKGRFSFEDIRPGKWTLKVYDQDLPVHHYLEHEEYQIELKPGEQKEITVKVLPRLRSIQIIDEGKIKQENK